MVARSQLLALAVFGSPNTASPLLSKDLVHPHVMEMRLPQRQQDVAVEIAKQAISTVLIANGRLGEAEGSPEEKEAALEFLEDFYFMLLKQRL